MKANMKLELAKASVRKIAESLRAVSKTLCRLEKDLGELQSLCGITDSDESVDVSSIDYEAFVEMLGPRARKALQKNGVVDAASLGKLSHLDLVTTQNCGLTTVRQIESAMLSHGLILKRT